MGLARWAQGRIVMNTPPLATMSDPDNDECHEHRQDQGLCTFGV